MWDIEPALEDEGTSDTDYYVSFSGNGVWTETVGPGVKTQLDASTMPHKLVRDARSKGTIGAVEIDSGGKSSYFNNSGKLIYKKLLDKGVILRPLGNVFPIVTPYCISNEDIDYIFQSLKEVLDEMIA